MMIFTMVAVLGCNYKHEKETPLNPYGIVEPTYSSLQRTIFTPKCASCHSGANAPHGVDCSSYETISSHVMFPPLTVPGQPESSGLYKAVVSGEMPKNASRLPQNEIDAIYTWIRNGAKKSEDQPMPGPEPTPPDEPCNPPCQPGYYCDPNLGECVANRNRSDMQNIYKE